MSSLPVFSPRTAGEIEPPPGWPGPPGRTAYCGLAGAIADAITPHTEADAVAVLGQLLVAAGSAAGRGAYFEVEATRHFPNEFVVLVGDSAKARKGSSWDHVARAMEKADPGFPARVHAGLSTGEGLIWAVRDPLGPDPGAADKRLLAVETEFASVLKATGRDMGTLSPVLRNAWDGRALQTLTRTAPARATGAHVSVIGHITAAELAALLSSVEVANGFMNRFLLLACRRVRLLPEGGAPDPLAGSGLGEELASAIKAARGKGQVRFGIDARAYWWDTYPSLSVAGPRLGRLDVREGGGPRAAPGTHLRIVGRCRQHFLHPLGGCAGALGLFGPFGRLGARDFERGPRRRADPRRIGGEPVRSLTHPDP